MSSLTGDDAFRVERVEGIVHELSESGGLVSAERVLHDERVVAVVEVSGFVEEEAAVRDRAVVRVGDELRVGVHRLHQRCAVVQPLDVRRRISVHSEGEAPVMLLLRNLQEQDVGWNWRGDANALHSVSALFMRNLYSCLRFNLLHLLSLLVIRH